MKRIGKLNLWAALSWMLFCFPTVLFGQSSSVTAQLSGKWTAYIPAKNWSQSGYQIIQNGQDLIYVIYNGERHNGRVLGENSISYVQANATGKVSPDGNRIDWTGGGYWLRQKKGPDKPPSKLSLTGGWVHSADRNTQTPTGLVIIVQDGDQVTKINSYKPYPDRSEWATLSCTGPLVGKRLNLRCNWAPGGDPLGFGPPKGMLAPWPETYDLSEDGNHLNGVGPQAQYYSRKP